MDDDDVGDICAYGIDGATGAYLKGPNVGTLADELESPAWNGPPPSNEAHWGVLDGDPADLADVGWGLVLLDPEGDPHGAAIRERNVVIQAALGELLQARSDEAKNRFKVMYARRGETRAAFLARYGQGEGLLDTRIVPYYMLLVASPDELDFAFQCSLDVQAAVGRLWFESKNNVPGALDSDDVEKLRRYASLYGAGQSAPRARHADFLGVNNDPATRSSSVELVQPVHDNLEAERWGWTKRSVIGPSRAAMLDRFTGAAPAGLVFVATHGTSYPKDDPEQTALQGALVCNEWPCNGPPAAEHLIAAANIPEDADLRGTAYFLFACYGLGTPRESDFVHLDRRTQRLELASAARIAPLAQRLLERGAPAVIGHVERAWSWSYGSPQLRELGHFDAAISGIVRGRRIGAALEAFGQRYADSAVTLASALEDRATTIPQPRRIARLWTKLNDARGYALLGDPALRIFGA